MSIKWRFLVFFKKVPGMQCVPGSARRGVPGSAGTQPLPYFILESIDISMFV